VAKDGSHGTFTNFAIDGTPAESTMNSR
jgi:hypothetical protein